jgi:hypothetical protein
LCLVFYRIDKPIELEMSRDLAERRDAFSANPSSVGTMMTRHSLAACAAVSSSPANPGSGTGASSTAPTSSSGLKGAFASAFMIGTALAPRQFEGTDTASVALDLA